MLSRPQMHHSLSLSQTYVKMPVDKHHNTAHVRPLMPTLSATNRSARPHITPRVAAAAASIGSGHGSATLSPPFNRRLNSPDPYAPSKLASTPTNDDQPSPFKAFLSSNITPRSSARKARTDSANTTPVATPDGTPVGAHSNAAADRGNTGPEPSLISADGGFDDARVARSKPLAFDVKSSPTCWRPESLGPSHSPTPGGRDDASPMFFFADDAKNAPRPALANKSSTFFYANDPHRPAVASPPVNQPPASPHGSSPPKFFHASDGPGLQSSFPATPVVSPRPTPATQNHPAWPPRPAMSSPVVVASPVVAPAPAQRSRPTPLATVTSSPVVLAQAAIPHMAPTTQSGSESSRNHDRHSRSTSLTSVDSATSSPRQRRVGFVQPHSLQPSPNIVGDDGACANDGSLEGERGSGAMESPAPTSAPATDASGVVSSSNASVSDLAANARRERKVLDLEISNSSLLAINRTLEREMRKQTAELRRFRRLSRSGRLSLASDARASGGRSSLEAGLGLGIADLIDQDSDEDEEDSFLDDLSPSEDSSLDDGSLSPSALAESDARHRAKDEKRLQLDLHKHQQLLIDSQKMNQSLKRCLGWTEELIAEGKKALAYHVRVSEVRLGGRVLVREEEDIVDEECEVGADGDAAYRPDEVERQTSPFIS